MPTLPSLRKAFRRAIATVIATSPAVGACGTKPGIEKDSDFVPVSCEQGSPRWLTNLEPEPPADFLELAGAVSIAQTTGEACKTATNLSVCQAALEMLRGSDVSSSQPALRIFTGVDHYDGALLRITRGDEVFAIDSLAKLRAFLGDVDTPEEAMLLTQASSYNVECKDGGARPADDGFEVQAFLGVGCGGSDRFLLSVARDGSVEVLDRTRVKDPEKNCVVGRRPAGLRTTPRPACTKAGDYLARAATLEAASVEAFRRMAAELKAHGAPTRLVAAALKAAQDEVRHAALTARLARQLGGRPEAPTVEAQPLRELEQIASDNATEGCVRETFGALEGRWQALHATDPAVRRSYVGIAEDELRHAALSWRVARWIEPRLDRKAQQRVNAARRRASLELRRALRAEPSPDVRLVCGVPSAATAQALFAAFEASIA